MCICVLFFQSVSSFASGYSLTNTFELPLVIYNGNERFDYTARPTLFGSVELQISGGEIHKELKDWFDLSVVLTRGISISGPTQETLETALSTYDAQKEEGDITNVFGDWTYQSFAKGKVTMTASFQKIPVIREILPELEDIDLSEVNALISTGKQVIVKDSGDTTTIYPGIYLYKGNSIGATAIKSIVSTVLKSIWPIIVSVVRRNSIYNHAVDHSVQAFSHDIHPLLIICRILCLTGFQLK